MTDERFWEIVEGTVDSDEQATALEAALAELEPDAIVDFEATLQRYLASAYSWDMWGVAYLMRGGASDDGFAYFRGWLIGRGRAIFEAAIGDPQTLADHFSVDDRDSSNFEDEELLYSPRDAFVRVTGDDAAFYADPRTNPGEPPEPLGDPWDEGDLERRFPRVAARFPARD